MTILWLDTETRSRVDLQRHGAYRYAEDGSTEITVVCWALDDAPVRTEVLLGRGLSPQLRAALGDPRVQVRAHNAAFDRLVMRHALGVDVPISRWYCTAAQARASAYPGRLDDLARALDSRHRKSRDGEALIRQLSMPREDGSFDEDPDAYARFARYCAADVEAMRAASKALPALDDVALRVYHANERINARGLPIDRELCQLAMQYADAERAEAAARVRELTAGAVTSPASPKLAQWVAQRLGPSALKLLQRVRTDSRTKAERRSLSLDEDARDALLAYAEEYPDDVPPEVAEVVQTKALASSAATSKFAAMLERCSADGRLRGAFVMNGAAQTGRFSSTGAQAHNFPRASAKNPEEIMDQMRRGEPLDGTLKTLKSLLRPAIGGVPGRSIVRCDWNAVEARGLPWLTQDPLADAYLDAFRDPERDVYVEQSHAAGLGGERQPGKVVVLSLGYGGAEGALARMAVAYGVKLSREPRQVVRAWREANGWAVDWWADLMASARRALYWPLEPQPAGRVTLASNGAALMMALPSGRWIHYPMAAFTASERSSAADDDIVYLKAAWRPRKDATEWPRARLWHGTLAENATQAACADLLRETLLRAEAQGIEVIGHVHDEVIVEAAEDAAEDAAVALHRCMLTLPDWAQGLPLAAEVKYASRFGK